MLTINTERLCIRNLKISDLADFHAYRSNPEVTKYQSFDVFTMEESQQFIQRNQSKKFGKPGEWIQYGIEDVKTRKLIGDCAIKLDQQDQRLAEIGITVSHQEQRKGYAKETMIALLDFLFSRDGFHRITEIVDAENTAAICLLECLGFKQEGHFIENIFFKGKWGSEFQYALLKREWNSQEIIKR